MRYFLLSSCQVTLGVLASDMNILKRKCDGLELLQRDQGNHSGGAGGGAGGARGESTALGAAACGKPRVNSAHISRLNSIARVMVVAGCLKQTESVNSRNSLSFKWHLDPPEDVREAFKGGGPQKTVPSWLPSWRRLTQGRETKV